MSGTIRKITAFEARTHLGEILDYVRYTKKPCLIEKHGKPVAAIIDINVYQKGSPQKQYDEWLSRAVEQIKVHYRPQKIILFGSAVRDELRDGSDIDLFIVKETDKRKMDRIDEVLDILDVESPIELHIYTPGEVEERLKIGDSFIQHILKEGRVLYDEAS